MLLDNPAVSVFFWVAIKSSFLSVVLVTLVGTCLILHLQGYSKVIQIFSQIEKHIHNVTPL